jgi:hypothetical protein
MIAPNELERLLIVMAQYGVTHLEAGDGIVINRALPSAPPDKPATKESPLERLSRLSPDEQDRELRLGHLGAPAQATRTSRLT